MLTSLSLFGLVASCGGDEATTHAALSPLEAGGHPPEFNEYVVYATNSIGVGDSASLHGHAAVHDAGDPGAQGAVADGVRASVGAWSNVGGSWAGYLIADTAIFRYGSYVWVANVGTPLLAQNGAGHVVMNTFPAQMPSTPRARPSWPGTQVLSVAASSTVTVSATASISRVDVASGGVLQLNGGSYQVERITLGNAATLRALGPVTLRVADRVDADDLARFDVAAGLTAKDLRIEVFGANGGAGGPLDGPLSVDLGEASSFRAVFVASRGTVRLQNGVQGVGAIAARDVSIGTSASVTFEDGVAPLTGTAPHVFDDAYVVAEDQTLDVSGEGVLLNDVDPEFVALTATVTDDVDHGTLTLQADGSFTYTPNPNFAGTDTFVYAASNGTETATAAVTITVDPANDIPNIVSVPEPEVFVGQLWTYQVVVDDPDQGDEHVFALSNEPAGMTMTADGLLSWMPSQTQLGASSFTVSVTDTATASDTQSVSMTVIATPASDGFVLYAGESIFIEGGATTVDGKVGVQATGAGTFIGDTARAVAHFWSVVGKVPGADLFADSVHIRHMASAQNIYTNELNAENGSIYTGSASLPAMPPLPAVAAVTPGTDALTHTGAGVELSITATRAGDVTVGASARLLLEPGLYEFASLTLDDGAAVAAQGPVEIRIAGRLYVGAEAFIGPAEDVDLGTNEIRIDVHAPRAVLGDPASLPYAVVTSTASSIAATLVAPNGTAKLGQYSYNWGFFGARDLYAAEGATFFLGERTPPNRPPVITSRPSDVVFSGETYAYQLEFVDPDEGDSWTFGLDHAPQGMTVDASGLVHWQPGHLDVGTASVSVRVTDVAGAFDAQTYALTVRSANNAPVFLSFPTSAAALEDVAFTIDINATDPDGDTITYALATPFPAGASIDPSSGVVAWTPVQADVDQSPVTITVRAFDGAAFVQQSFTVTVTGTNDAPEFVSSPVTTADEESPYLYTLQAIDPDSGDTLTYALGSGPSGMSLDPQTGALSWTPTQSDVGSPHTVEVAVTDAAGASDTQTFSITVNEVNDAPTLSSAGTQSTAQGELFQFTISASDPDHADTLTFSLGAAPASMTIDAPSGTVQWTPSSSDLGLYSFTVTVTDAGGLSDTETYEVDVADVNDAPSFTSTPNTSATEGSSYSYDADATDPDAGDTLTFSLSSGPGGMSIDPASGQVTWTPGDDQTGDLSVTLRVEDASGAQDIQTFTITVAGVNDAPVFESTPVTSVLEGTSYGYAAQASDPDPGDTVTYALGSRPAGMAINAQSGFISWLPASGSAGSYPVTVTAMDGAGLSAQQQFTLTVLNINDAPTFVSGVPAPTAIQGQAYSYTADAIDYDVGDVVTYALDVAPTGMSIGAEDGQLSWTPSASQVGDFSVVIVAQDLAGAFDLLDFTITVVDQNDAPAFVTSPLLSASENQQYTYAAMATDPDTNDVVTYAVQQGPVGLSVHATSGVVSWVPSAAQVGSHSVTLVARDSAGATDTQGYTVTVAGAGESCTPGDTRARCAALAWTYATRRDSVPLGNVTVSEVGPGGARTIVSDLRSGLVTLGGTAGDHRWLFSALGHVPVLAKGTLPGQAISWVAAPRMAPLTDMQGGLPVTGTSFDDVDGRLELTFHPGAVSVPATVSAAVLDGQSLPGFLPYGWSPTAALWYESDAPINIGPDATFTLPAPLPPSTTLVLARWDEATRVWLASAEVTPASPTDEFPVVTATLGDRGGYALLLADTGLTAPGSVTIGAALPESAFAPPGLSALTIDGAVDPEYQAASSVAADVTGLATLHASTATAALPSGMVVPSRLFEQYDLASAADTEVPSLDLAVAFYAYPPVAEAPAGALAARFPVRPRFLLSAEDVADVHQRIDIKRQLSFIGAPMDAQGGLVAEGGVVLSVPTNAFADPTLVSLNSIDPDALHNGATTATIAFQLEWSGGALAAGQRISLEAGGVAANRDYVLARRELSEVRVGWAPVERFQSDASGTLVSVEPSTGTNRLSGITTGGTYALFEVAVPQGIVRGDVTNAAGDLVVGAIVQVQGTPWLLVTGADGLYESVASPGLVRVDATLPQSTDNDTASGTLTDAQSVLELNLVVGPRAPRVVSVRPAAGATRVSVVSPVEVRFSEPVVLPVAGGLTVVDAAAQPVAGRASLRPDRRTLTFLADVPFAYDTAYTVSLDPAITDDDAQTLTGTVSSFSFTTIPAPARPGGGARLISWAPGEQNTPCAPYDPATVPAGFDPTELPSGVPGFDPTDSSITCVVGAAGVADASSPVILVNEDTGATASVISRPSGAFKGFIRADEEHLLSATLVNANGTRLEIPLERQNFDDGTVALYASGGVVEGPNPLGAEPLELIIEPTAIGRRAKFKLEGVPQPEFQAEVATAPPIEGSAIMGVRLEFEGELRVPPDIRFPVAEADLNLPPGVAPEDYDFLLTKLSTVTIDGQGIRTYEVLDHMVYEDGALATHSFPYTLLLDVQQRFTPISLPLSTAVAGWAVVCDPTSGLDCAVTDPVSGGTPVAHMQQLSPPEGRRLPGTVVYGVPAGGASASATPLSGQLVAVADRTGYFTIGLPWGPLSSRGLRALHPDFPGIIAQTDLEVVSANHLGGDIGANIVFRVPGANNPQVRLTVTATPSAPLPWDFPDPNANPPTSQDRAWIRAEAIGHQLPPAVTIRDVLRIDGGPPMSLQDVRLRVRQPRPADAANVAVYELVSRYEARVRLNVVHPNAPASRTTVYFGAPASSGTDIDAPAEPHDMRGPMVESSWPAPGATISPGATIRLTFDEAIKRSALSRLSQYAVSPGGHEPVSAWLSRDQRTLSLVYADLDPSTRYRLDVAANSIVDFANNPLGSDALHRGGRSYALQFRTSAERSYSLQSAAARLGGAVVSGAYAYAIDKTNGGIEVLDVSDPSSVTSERTERLSSGAPRDLDIIEGFSWVRPASDSEPCGTFPWEEPWERGFAQGVPYGPGCLHQHRTLLLAIGGPLSTQHNRLNEISTQGQTLLVYDVTDAPAMTLIEEVRISGEPTTTTFDLLWSPPAFAYVERSSSLATIHAVDLQEMLIAARLTSTQRSDLLTFHRNRSQNPQTPLEAVLTARIPGEDRNGDGDYIDQNDELPVPHGTHNGVTAYGYGGRYLSVFPEGTTQDVRAHDFNGPRSFVATVTSDGYLLDTNGLPSTTTVAVAYRTLAADGRPNLDFAWPAGAYQRFPIGSRLDAVRFLPDLTIRTRGPTQPLAEDGADDVLDVVIVGGQVSAPAAGQSRLRLWVLDVSNPTGTPIALGDTDGIPVPETVGNIQTIALDPADPSRLQVVGAAELATFAIDRLTMPTPTSSEAHPSLVATTGRAGTPQTADGRTNFGLTVLADLNSMVFTGPKMEFVRFAASSSTDPIITPRAFTAGLTGGRTANDLAVEALLDEVVPVRGLRPVRHVAPSADYPVNQGQRSFNYHVLVRAPGGLADSNGRIALMAEGLNDAGYALPNPPPYFAPVRASTRNATRRLGPEPNLPYPTIHPLTAFRLSSEKASPYYNVFLSDPIILTHQKVEDSQLAALRDVGGEPRTVLHSPFALRVSIDPDVHPQGRPSGHALTPFASRIDTSLRSAIPGTHIQCEAFPAWRIPGPNPAPVVGDTRAPGTMGWVSVHNRELRIEETDLTLPSTRMPIAFSRSYRDQDLFDGPLGSGWTFNYHQRIIELKPHVSPADLPLVVRGARNLDTTAEPGDLVLYEDGDALLYRLDLSSGSPPAEYSADPLIASLGWVDHVEAWYHPPDGVFDALVKMNTGQFVRLTPDGRQYWYAASGRLKKVFHRYSEIRHELVYNERGELREIVDDTFGQVAPRHRRRMTLGYYRASGDPLFEGVYDFQTSLLAKIGHIAKIKAEAGGEERSVLFEYSPEGELTRQRGIQVSVGRATGAPARRTTTYAWEQQEPHTIRGLSDRRGPIFGVRARDADLVIEETTGHRGDVTISGPANRAEVMAAGNYVVNVATADSAVKTYQFTAYGLPELVVASGPGSPSLRSSYTYSRMRARTVTDVAGVVSTYTYGAQTTRSKGNVESLVEVAGGNQRSTSTTYDLNYNFVERRDLPNGNYELATPPGGLDILRVDYHSNNTTNTPFETWRYDGRTGFMLRHTDPNGLTIDYTPDSDTGFVTLTVEGAVRTRFEYTGCVGGALGNVCVRSPALSAREVFGYDERGGLVSVTKDAYSETLKRDERGQVRESIRTVESGVAVTTRHVTLPSGFVERTTVDDVETNGTTSTHETVFTPDTMQRVVGVNTPGTGGTSTILDRDHVGRVRQTTTGQRVRGVNYNSTGGVQSRTAGPGAQVLASYSYTPFGEPEVVTDAEGGQTTLGYDDNGNVRSFDMFDTTRGRAVKQMEVPSRDALDRPLQLTHAPGVTSTFNYDGVQRDLSITGPRGAQRDIGYDASGALRSDNIPGLVERRYTPDAEGRIEDRSVMVGGPTGQARNVGGSVAYDSYGHVREVRDSDHRLQASITRRFDGLSTSVSVPKGTSGAQGPQMLTTETPRTKLGEVKAIQKPSGRRVDFDRDADRRRTREVVSAGSGSPAVKSMGYSYDASGAANGMTFPNGSSMTVTSFDPVFHRPQNVDIPGGSVSAGYDGMGRMNSRTTSYQQLPAETEGREYDPLDRVVEASSPTGAQTFEYDLLGVQTLNSFLPAGAAGPLSLGRGGYDDGTTRLLTYPSGTEVEYDRQIVGRLDEVLVDRSTLVDVLEYATMTRTATIGLGSGGVSREDVYDVRQRLRKRRYLRGGDTIIELRYAYDPADREVARQALHRGGRTDLFAYDDDSRLEIANVAARLAAGAVTSAGAWTVSAPPRVPGQWSPGAYQRAYSFSAASTGHDRLLATATAQRINEPAPRFASTMTYPTSVPSDDFVEAVDGQARTPDPLRNTSTLELASGPATLLYDGQARLRFATRADGASVVYMYRPDGALWSRQVTNCPSGAADCVDSHRQYVYDGLLLLEEYETSGTGRDLRARYYYADEGDIPVAADLWDGQQLVRYFYAVDRMGSIIGLINEAGQLVERIDYDPYGHPTVRPADTQAPELAEVLGDPNGGLYLVFSEPVVPKPTLTSTTIITTVVDASSYVQLVDDLATPIPVVAQMDYEYPGYPAGTVLQVTPATALTLGDDYTVSIASGALVDDWTNEMTPGSAVVTYGNGVLFSGAPVGSSAVAPVQRSTVGNTLGFQAHLHDWDTGLILARARVLDPSTGTFLQRDPEGFLDSVNMFAAMAWDPVNKRDPTGRYTAKLIKQIGKWIAKKPKNRLGRQKMINSKWGGQKVDTAKVAKDTRVSKAAIESVESRFPGIEVPHVGEKGVWSHPDYEKATTRVGDAWESGIVKGKVKIDGFKGDSGAEIDEAWRKYASDKGLKPKDVEALKETQVMHHSLKDGEMLLMDKEVHDVYRHTGGDGLAKHGFYEDVMSGVGFLVAPSFMEAQDGSTSKKVVGGVRDFIEVLPMVGDAATVVNLVADEVGDQKRSRAARELEVVDKELRTAEKGLTEHCRVWPGMPGCE